MKRSFFSALSLACYLSSCAGPPPKPPVKLPSVVVTKPTVKTVPLYLDYPGHMEAYNSINVQTQIAGELTGMYFEEGSEVKAGQLLFTIDSRPYRAALDRAEAALAQGVAALRYAEETAVRYSKLVQDEYVAQLKYDQYLTDVLVEQGTVEARKAEVETAKLNLGYTTIYSPIGGIAGKKQIDVGNYVSVAETPSLITVNQISPIYASFYVPDVDLPKIQKYQAKGALTAHVFLNGDMTEPYEGKLTLIDNQVMENTASIFMKATLCNEDKALWPGEFIDVRLILTTIPNALLLPTQCVQIGPEQPFVFTVGADDVVAIKKVKTGQHHGDMIVIEQGITAQDTIVMEGQLNLYGGAKVHIETNNNVPKASSNDSVTRSEDTFTLKPKLGKR